MPIDDLYVDTFQASWYRNLRESPNMLRSFVEDYSGMIAGGGTKVKVPTFAERQVNRRNRASRLTLAAVDTVAFGSHDLDVGGAGNQSWQYGFKIGILDENDARINISSRAGEDQMRSYLLDQGDYLRGVLDAELEKSNNARQLGADIDVSKGSFGSATGSADEQAAVRKALIEDGPYRILNHAYVNRWSSVPAEVWMGISRELITPMKQYFMDVARFGTGMINDQQFRQAEFLSTMLGMGVYMDDGIPVSGEETAAAQANTAKRVNRIYCGKRNYGVAYLEKTDAALNRWVDGEAADQYILIGRRNAEVWNPTVIGAVYLTGNAVKA